MEKDVFASRLVTFANFCNSRSVAHITIRCRVPFPSTQEIYFFMTIRDIPSIDTSDTHIVQSYKKIWAGIVVGRNVKDPLNRRT